MSNAKIKRSKKFLIEFFELYRKQLCLWNNENRYYNDKRRRNQALEILTRKMKEVNPNANRHETLKKINMYRSSFNREQKRREIRDDSGKCRIHKPRLWYYKHLQFLQCAKTTSLWRRDVSNENSQVVSKVRYILPQGGGQINLNNHKQEPPLRVYGPSKSLRSTTYLQQNGNMLYPEQQQLGQQREADRATLYICDETGRREKAYRRLDREKDELTAVVENIGNKLKLVPRHKLPMVEKLIGDLLYETRFREVDRFTRINLYEEIPSFEQTFLSGRPGLDRAVEPQRPVMMAKMLAASMAVHGYCSCEGCCVDNGRMQMLSHITTNYHH